MKKILITIGSVALIALIAVLLQRYPQVKADVVGNVWYGSGTNTGVICAKGASTLLATGTPQRQYIHIQNTTQGIIWISLGTSAATSSGIELGAATSTTSVWDSGGGNILYTGPIYCLEDTTNPSTVGSTTITSLP